ncbi:flagellar basal body P-ring protein FlgI [Buchnera aphidicola]|uniref:flagellar basal body P-ring protein FlgI n=1 Tax=Buchnera aphidicola TaxID=9 RepID=UPI0034647BE9
MSWLKKILGICLVLISLNVYAEKIKNISIIQTNLEDKLIGYGLVVGLDGTGDHISEAIFTSNALNNMLLKLGINNIGNKNLKLKNIASVIVTANLSSSFRKGEKINVMVSSIGNSNNLKNGILLNTPLKGTNNKIYAIAQGKISTKNHMKNFSTKQDTFKCNGIIPFGALIKKSLNNHHRNHEKINLQIFSENFNLIQKISSAINNYYPNVAIPINNKTIELKLPLDHIKKNYMLSKIQNIDIPIFKKKYQIIFNKKDGLIMMNNIIHINECIIENNNISIFIKKNQHYIIYNKNNHKKYFFLKSYNHLDELINLLNTLKLQKNEILSILKNMKNMNCFQAHLKIV